MAMAPPPTSRAANNEEAVSTSLVILNGFLVFFMQVGFLVLETGSGRAKNVRNILVKNLLDVMLAAMVWWGVGYAFAYGRSAGGVIGTSHFFYEGETLPDKSIRPWFFSWTFCIAACTIISGCLAERTALAAYPAATVAIAALVHPLLVHWIWNSNGWLAQLNECNVLDFAGGMVVHMVGGVFGLVGAWRCGPRLGRFELSADESEDGDDTPEGDDGAAAAAAPAAAAVAAAAADDAAADTAGAGTAAAAAAAGGHIELGQLGQQSAAGTGAAGSAAAAPAATAAHAPGMPGKSSSFGKSWSRLLRAGLADSSQGDPQQQPPQQQQQQPQQQPRQRRRTLGSRCRSRMCKYVPQAMPGHDMAFVTLGTFMLWFGWYSFNAGSVYAYLQSNPSQLAGSVAGTVSAEVVQRTSMNTALGGSAAGLTALLSAAWLWGTYDLRICCNGVLSGLVIVTCMCGFVDPWAAVVCCAIAGGLYAGASWLLLRVGIDDPLDSSVVHLGGGLLGSLMVAFFANPRHVQALTGAPCGGVFYSHTGWLQLGLQLLGISVVLALAGGVAFVLFAVLDRYQLLRVDQTTELAGIDNMQHGGLCYGAVNGPRRTGRDSSAE